MTDDEKFEAVLERFEKRAKEDRMFGADCQVEWSKLFDKINRRRGDIHDQIERARLVYLTAIDEGKSPVEAHAIAGKRPTKATKS